MSLSKHDCPISFRAPKELVARLDSCAEKLCQDRSSLLKMIIKIWLDRFEGNEQEIYSHIFPLEKSGNLKQRRVYDKATEKSEDYEEKAEKKIV